MASSKLLCGIDLGGTKIEGVVVESSAPEQPLCRLRLPTEQQQGYQYILDQIRKLHAAMQQECNAPLASVGISHPGAIDRKSGKVKNSNTTCLIGKALHDDLAALLRAEIFVENDANCFALAEAHFGAGRGAKSVFGVIMGTGVGGGIVLDGKVHGGLQGIAGEWGHNQLLEDGPNCYCGKQGCVETIISGPALERHYQLLAGEQRPLAEILERAAVGSDPAACLVAERLAEYFGKALSVVVNILDPECIVLGGGVSNAELLYRAGIAALERYTFNDSLQTKVVCNQLGDSAGVFGAALLTVN